MFIGKSVCIGAVVVIAMVSIKCVFDKDIDAKSSIALVALTSVLGAIVASL